MPRAEIRRHGALTLAMLSVLTAMRSGLPSIAASPQEEVADKKRKGQDLERSIDNSSLFSYVTELSSRIPSLTPHPSLEAGRR
mmetsp:Transcript_39575/g.101628  ORF Transcript_39575/g.101628 Transcript_39575/m.101628 type:complete len:83 (-) Transcript_39575:701-949(-)